MALRRVHSLEQGGAVCSQSKRSPMQQAYARERLRDVMVTQEDDILHSLAVYGIHNADLRATLVPIVLVDTNGIDPDHSLCLSISNPAHSCVRIRRNVDTVTV